MNKLILVIGICSLLTFSTLTMTVAAAEPTVRLPTQYVTMRAINGSTAWFDMTLLNVPQGYDVINTKYLGWCVQLNTILTRGVNHTVRLYSSYDPAKPEDFKHDNWDKVNYVINHKQGGSKSTIQEVIWWYICDDPVPINDTMAKNIVTDADLYGGNFTPSFGQNIAILVDIIHDGYEIQRSFFEFPLSNQVPIGDLVWKDNNQNGIQDTGEPGFPGITVGLYTPSGTEIDSVNTDIHGYYSFGLFSNGSYYIKFTLPSGYKFSPANQGSDDTKDSDANPTTGKTINATFDPNKYNASWDAGMYPVDEGGNPVPPVVPSNFAPTADGTAGEPYTARAGEVLRFDGSRSYDRDGTVVSWLWSFGDGTTANGEIVNHTYATNGTFQVYLTVTDNDGATDRFETTANIKGPNQPPLKPTLTGPTEGRRTIDSVFNVMTTDPNQDDVRYIIQWGDNSQYTSPFVKNGNSVQIMHGWTTSGVYTLKAYAEDPYNKTSEIYETIILIDARYVGNLGYLRNTDINEGYDVFYSNSTGQESQVQRQENGIILIDTNNDGSYDYKYNPTTNTYEPNSGTLGSLYPILIVGVIVAIVLLLLLWLLARRKKNKPNP